MCNFFLFLMGQESFKDVLKYVLIFFLWLNYLGYLFSFEHEKHTEIKRKQCLSVHIKHADT